MKTKPPDRSPANAPALVTPLHTAPRMRGPENAAIMQPVPIHTIIVTFISNICQARSVQSNMIITVLILLTFRTRLSISSSSKFFLKRGTKVNRYRSFATIWDDETTKPSAVDITAARIPTPSKAANQLGNNSIKSKTRA